MRIDYCPKCHKAGLKYQRYLDSPYSNPPLIPTEPQAKENSEHLVKDEKWCPRCKEWVKPENHPYVGVRGH